MSKENVETIRKFEECFSLGRGKVEEAFKYVHDDFAIREAPSLPYGGVHRGKEAVLKLMSSFLSFWDLEEELKFTYWDAGDDVVVAHVTGKVRLKATGRSMDLLVAEWYYFSEGKIKEILVFYWDQKPIYEAAAATAKS